jgi:hypothetical protein
MLALFLASSNEKDPNITVRFGLKVFHHFGG